MRIKTSGSKEHRLDDIRRVMEVTGEPTKSGAIDFALEFTTDHLRRLERAKDHPDMTPKLAEVLSSDLARVAVEQHTELRING